MASPPPGDPALDPDYLAVRAKVDAFVSIVSERRAADLACRRGCSGCCQVQLSVSAVEAQALRAALLSLPSEARERLHARAAQDPSPVGPCVMLEEDGACAVYAARPLVCRTQGLPLRYPAGLVPPAAVLLKVASGAVTCCPLNFTSGRPAAADILDAERVDQLLALVNRRHAEAHAQDPLARTPLRALAREGGSTGSPRPESNERSHR